MNKFASKIVIALTVALLGACAQTRPVNDQAPVYSPSRPGATAEYGVVSAVDHLDGEQQLSGGGAVLGGVAGAVFGRQFGNSSDGRALGTFLGAIAGLLIGNQVEKDTRGPHGGVRVSIQLDAGGQRSFDYADAGGLRVGDRVRIEGNRIVRM